MTQLNHTSTPPTQFEGFKVCINAQQARADIILDRPPFNLVSIRQAEQLRTVFEALDIDSTIRVIVLRALGEHFSRGCEFEGSGHAAGEDLAWRTWTMDFPSRCGKPVIAANRGYCFGAGFELSLACDFRIATETTLYALPAQSVGLGCGSGGAGRLQQMVGIGRTRDVVMRSRYIRGAQAYDWGVATDFVADAELENLTDTLVRELLASSPLVQRAAKRLLNAMENAALAAQTELEG
ncbi:enoyl-CoA hydratase/isomerase family protein [Paraburkholderia sp. DHOC27]|uniref:enoyl-CoA hydratase/isomerase family protein n=1 Tax=Paraburkholderia sp. DHOC27 TaxID=2303330 RepID=UPI000E3C0F36|nr:enoyl-CoA hydratase/isomerase family protein [Paraburkholderia sp. DHOC27]RFU46628.1 enoyl-CoA hydratase/isomerase family protein [Paraburkholderia sp. DHOC27]